MDYLTNNIRKSRKNKHLNYVERKIIEIRLKGGWSVYKIAKELGRTINTVNNEIKRNTVKKIKQNK